MLVGDADVVASPGFGRVEKGGEFRDEVDAGGLVGRLADEDALLGGEGVVGWGWGGRGAGLIVIVGGAEDGWRVKGWMS